MVFKTGSGHAGEHLAEVRDQRRDPAPPIQMSDALARNAPGIIPLRPRPVDAFSDEVAFVLETLRSVFYTDQQAQQ